MGKTLLGVDLDESPAGRLVERLLSEEELEMLADGGREPAGDADDETDGDEANVGGDRTDADDDPYSDTTSDVTFVDGSDADAGDPRESDADVSATDRTRSATCGGDDAETPSPGGASGIRGRIPAIGGDDDEEGDEDGGGLVAKAKSLLPKVVAAVVALAVVAFVVKRYGGRVVSAVKGKLGRGNGEDDGGASEPPRGVETAGESVPAARRRAKATDEDLRERDVEVRSADEHAATGKGPRALADQSDTGALVGLAFLALVAALVRKFTEPREYDPLVDGPERERRDR